MNDRELFITVFQMNSSEERAAYLDAACGTDQERRQRIEKLLQRHEESESFLNPDLVDRTAAFELHSSLSFESPALEQAGDQIGTFKLLQKLGDGGMGTVWVAEQEKPVKRRVALKLVKAGMDTAEVLRRFEAERQALAMMDHTNIAKVFDAGTNAQGRPYFVMELIKGVPITRYCDEVHASIRDRLDLFIQICSAVQHAHQKGIIHRDIKPSNVLVAMQDGKPVPKVIDFGVAKALHNKLADKTMYTEIGQVVGTLEYMAPEQAELSAMDIDTRADIYALGILLYELLTGSTPITRQRMKSAAFAEVLRIIKEEEPPKPSTRLSESKESMASVASLRRTDPKHLSSELRGELDWVVMKALEKDRTRRYETANGLSRDLQRYLANETVEARPPSAGYRLRKFVLRNRGQVIAAGLVVLSLVVGVIGTTLGLLEARRQTQMALDEMAAKEQARAEEEVQRKRAVEFRDKALDALRATTSTDVELLIGSKTELGSNERAYLEAIAKRWQSFAKQEGTDEQARAIRAEGHHRVAYLWQKLGRWQEARLEYEQALVMREKLAADFPAVPEYLSVLATSHNCLGIVHKTAGKQAEAEEQYKKAIVIHEKLAESMPPSLFDRRGMGHAYHNLGNLLADMGKRTDAEEQYRKALTIQEKLAAEFPKVPDHCKDLAGSHTNLGNLLASQGKRSVAQEQYKKALVIQEKLAADFPAVPSYRLDLAASHNTLGILLTGLGKRAEAEEYHNKALAIREKLAGDFPAVPEYRRELAKSHNSLGVLVTGLGRRAEAEGRHKQAIVIREKLAADFPAVPEYCRELAMSHSNLGGLLAILGKRPEAEEHHNKALVIRERLTADFPAVPDYRRDLALSHNNLGALLAGQGKRPEALEQYNKALAIQDKLAADFPTVPSYRVDLAASHNNLGNLLRGLEKHPEALEQYKKALAILERLVADFPAVPNYRRDLAASHNNLGVLLADMGRRAEAEEHHKQALVLREKLAADFPAVPEYRLDLGGSYCNFGNMVRDGGRPNESLDWFEKAIATLTPVHITEPRDVATKRYLRNSFKARALAYEQLHKCADAVKDWDRAVELSPSSEKPGHRALRATSRVQAGQVDEAVAEVAELTKSSNWNAGQWYDFACVYAVASGKIVDKKQEYAERAMELLHQAVKAGYKNSAHIKKDTDLDPLRTRDDFKKLMAELKKK